MVVQPGTAFIEPLLLTVTMATITVILPAKNNGISDLVVTTGPQHPVSQLLLCHNIP